jgi:hypothetical protein
MMLVSEGLASGDFFFERWLVGYSAIEALAGQTASSDSAMSSQLPCLGV